MEVSKSSLLYGYFYPPKRPAPRHAGRTKIRLPRPEPPALHYDSPTSETNWCRLGIRSRSHNKILNKPFSKAKKKQFLLIKQTQDVGTCWHPLLIPRVLDVLMFPTWSTHLPRWFSKINFGDLPWQVACKLQTHWHCGWLHLTYLLVFQKVLEPTQLQSAPSIAKPSKHPGQVTNQRGARKPAACWRPERLGAGTFFLPKPIGVVAIVGHEHPSQNCL